MHSTVTSSTPRRSCCSPRSVSSTTRSSQRMSVSITSQGLAGYRVDNGRYDDLIAPTGETRPAWKTLSRVLATLDSAEIAARKRQADRLIEAEGASHLFHEDADDTSRPWSLDPLPLVIAGEEWR